MPDTPSKTPRKVARWTGSVMAHERGGFVAYGDYLDLEREVAELREDAERLDYLEREANEDALVLHNLPLGADLGGHRGLGLKCTNRTLRQAIDQMRGFVSTD